MNVLIVYAHPNSASFNKAILEIVHDEFVRRGDDVRVRDLYAEQFNPVLNEKQLALQNEGKVPEDVAREQGHVAWADMLVLIYPLWWFDRPAILKGWFDKVFTNGFAFSFNDDHVQGLLTGKRAMVIVTTGGTEEDFGRDADQLTRSTTEGTLAFCGITEIIDRVFYSVPIIDDAARQSMLHEVKNLVREI